MKIKMESEQQWKTSLTFESRGLYGVQNTVEQFTSTSDRHFAFCQFFFVSTDKTKNMTHSSRVRCVTFVYLSAFYQVDLIPKWLHNTWYEQQYVFDK